ncbi:hypothetical protein J7I94_02010 [Streptomyces sp. ISL-12]|uniref:hypothetical protein n=1 Tax=Streptomyces sp. ISL-12 TaxID=2819177 RepID=UPI001BEB718B|nr:hypothetical protein [Streptomyces sp. ISL-12]MBT2409346.1 hypothetical protein [Streptomyces sp. ISL-12]
MSFSTGYRSAAAFLCAAALGSLTACAGTTTSDESTGGSTSARSTAPAVEAPPNGIEVKTSTDIYNLSHAANAKAGSSRQQMSRSNASSDLRVSATECTGTVKLTDLGSYDLVLQGDEAWIKPDSALAKWMNGEAGENLLESGTWYHGTLDNHFVQSLTSYCHTDAFTSPDTLDTSTKVSKGTVTTLDGQRVIPVVMEANGETVKWYAAVTGEPYLVAQVSSHEDMTDVTYSDFGTPVNAQKPSGDVREAPEN